MNHYGKLDFFFGVILVAALIITEFSTETNTNGMVNCF